MLKPPAVPRAAAIDVGKTRVGVAVADELGLLAHPRPYVDGRDPRRAIDALAKLAKEDGIELFLVGLPKQLDGSEGISARRARRFALGLSRRSALPNSRLGNRSRANGWCTTKSMGNGCAC